MTYTQSRLIPSFNLPLGTLVAKINYFMDMKGSTSLTPWQDGEKIQTSRAIKTHRVFLPI